ncbi:MBL fold metallo-hydrolase [Sulfuracidifex tepidarius]|uniref:Metallo-beta-lactamase domain-containing protein n=1 Tax=Sulfuracidifex tepidarius TaxID=1294262 RepID=A0A510DZA4_9CREN|nr:MBL fold metallo-hydrolase [Sulfuracidifex tepidarius]BBG25248.1 hypothetical protein IC006_2583 [Sulfuracidifex tepidarius]BBG28042.1 hypothetical protein IC007_2597 [Sulfuracidifex tepidarius]
MIRYFGHSALLFDSILLDPHDGGSIGLQVPDYPEVKLVLVTHDHYDHNAYQIVKYEVLKEQQIGTFDLGSYLITGYKSFHDKENGKRRGKNVIYKIKRKSDNFTLVHMGDLGHSLNDELMKELRGANLLALPVGGIITIDSKEASELVEQLEPEAIIPLHYWTKGHYMPLDPVESFLELEKNKFEINKICPKNANLDETNIKGKLFYL